MPKESPLRAGARVGPFVVLEEIGVGATSVVYEAEHRTLRNRVAIKVLRASTEMDHELRRRFEREMHLLANVVSLHVPHVYDVGEIPSGLPYIVMERLSGSTLADWLARHRKLPLPLAVEICTQLCTALAALHEAGALHRDVKPENLVLHQDGAGTYVVKLVDFGICKPLEDDGPPLTLRGTVVGTPEYMSPEQVQGLDADRRTDVYSTGVVLYELLAGRTPFEGHGIEDLGRAILVEDPPRLRSLCPECPKSLESIVNRAMSRKRTVRHESMNAFRRELERFSEEYGLRGSPRVWSMLPGDGPGQVFPLTRAKRSSHSTEVTAKLPLEKRSVIGFAVATAAVIAGLSAATYYVFSPSERAVAAIEPARTPPLEIAQAIEPASLTEVGEPSEAEPAQLIDAGMPVPPMFDAGIPPVPAPGPAVAEAETAPEDEAAAEEEEEERPSRRRRRMRYADRSVTTIAVAPNAPVEVAPSDTPVAPIAPIANTIRQDDLYAQLGTPPPVAYVSEEPQPGPEPQAEPAEPEEPPRRERIAARDIPSSPYDDPSVPHNPFSAR